MTAVLITGASSGIGHATAARLARRPDLTVYATARRPEQLADLADAGCRVMRLDVTDEASMAKAVASIEAEHGSVGILINNAGYGEYGTIEETDLDRVRTQFETNVFGLARMCQLVLPAMRAAGRGRIINVSSMGGRFVLPLGGYYHASKYAVEAISDALRFETAPFGIDVSIIEPGMIRTRFADTAGSSLSNNPPAGPYQTLKTALDKQIDFGYGSPLLSAEPDSVAAVIERAITARQPKSRYLTTPAGKLMVHTRRLFGGRFFDGYLRMQFKVMS